MIPRERIEPGVVLAEWWHRLPDGRLQCDLCPRFCKLHEGQRGFCFVREAKEGKMRLTSYGRASGFCIDPIEKKPLNHFYPGSSVFSFGTAGCNLGCRFCQNWDISKARQIDRLQDWATPEVVLDEAVKAGCRSIAFTYNDPVIFAEYAIDCAKLAREKDIKTVAVSAGYINPEPRVEFYRHMDAANIDLKAFSQEFYHRVCYGDLEPVLDTLLFLKLETRVWLEVTTLLIPGLNDSESEVARLSEWFLEHLGPETPLHFTAFHPDYKMAGIERTPAATLLRAREQARKAGLHYVYIGNIRDAEGQTTYCASCRHPVIEREGYDIRTWWLDESGCCKFCGTLLPGHFDKMPGGWGGKRRVVSIR